MWRRAENSNEIALEPLPIGARARATKSCWSCRKTSGRIWVLRSVEALNPLPPVEAMELLLERLGNTWMRCKQPFKKSISRACWPISRSSSAIRPSDHRCFPLPGNALPGPSRNSRHQETPCSSCLTAASLNSFVNCLRDNPVTQILHSMNFECLNH
jgi:hypothetical protein